jgi:hypothetical protein
MTGVTGELWPAAAEHSHQWPCRNFVQAANAFLHTVNGAPPPVERSVGVDNATAWRTSVPGPLRQPVTCSRAFDTVS